MSAASAAVFATMILAQFNPALVHPSPPPATGVAWLLRRIYCTTSGIPIATGESMGWAVSPSSITISQRTVGNTCHKSPRLDREVHPISELCRHDNGRPRSLQFGVTRFDRAAAGGLEDGKDGRKIRGCHAECRPWRRPVCAHFSLTRSIVFPHFTPCPRSRIEVIGTMSRAMRDADVSRRSEPRLRGEEPDGLVEERERRDP